MKKITFKISNLNKAFKSILIYTLTPCLLMVLFSFVFLFLSIDSQVNTHIRQHTDRINSLHQAIEYKINNVSYIFSLCNNDADFLAALMDDRNDTSSVNKIQSTLNLVYSSIPYLDSIAVYDKGTNTVITTDGHSNISDFFSGYNYTDYTAEYWYNYKYSISKPRFLPPTNVTTKNDIKLIVPLVYSQLGDNYLNKLIIFNIDFGIILSDEEYRVAADNSTIGVINRLTNQVFSPSYKSQPYPLSDELSTIFNKNNTYSGVHSINGKHSLIVYSSPSRSALSYSCFTSIPYASIFNDALQSTLILFALILISSLCAVILAYIFSKRTYAPIRHLELSLDPDNNNSNNSNNNSYENIQLSISQLQQKAESFEIQYENSLSKIQNMYLINLLNTENEHISSDISSYFEFKHDYFCAIIYQIIPKDSFRNEYDYYTYEKLIQNSSLVPFISMDNEGGLIQRHNFIQNKSAKERREVKVFTDLDAFIPQGFIADNRSRLEVYSRISTLSSVMEADVLMKDLRDIYGIVPTALKSLIYVALVKNLASKINATSVTFKKFEGIITFDKLIDVTDKLINSVSKCGYASLKMSTKPQIVMKNGLNAQKDLINFLVNCNI